MVLEVNKKCLIASAGFDGDRSQLHKVLTLRSENYEHFHKKPMSCPAMAQMLGNTLYYKRFFPYYTFNLCAGLDDEGRGCVYTYDAIGSHERVGYSCQGSGKDLVQPVLDNQLKAPSILELPPKVSCPRVGARAPCFGALPPLPPTLLSPLARSVVSFFSSIGLTRVGLSLRWRVVAGRGHVPVQGRGHGDC